jgi:hypothetical protein
MNLNQITQCYIDKKMFLNDRDCIPKDPTAEIIDVVAVIDRRLKRSFNTEKIHLKIIFDHWQSGYDEDDHYVEQYRSVNQYCYEIDKIYRNECPPIELEILIKWAYVHNLDAFYAFLWYCERSAAESAAEYAKSAAKSAAEYAKYAAESAAESAKSAAESAAEYAKYAAEYAKSAAESAKYAEIKQIEFLRACLGGNQP